MMGFFASMYLLVTLATILFTCCEYRNLCYFGQQCLVAMWVGIVVTGNFAFYVIYAGGLR